jgi:hypothetical protein
LGPNISGQAARATRDAGTDLHAHTELALRLNAVTADWLPDPEQRQHIKTALDGVRGLMRPHLGGRLYIEEHLGPPRWRWQGDLWGTADAVIVASRLLAIVDCKFGVHSVEATSPQLQIYLSLAVERYGPRPLMLTAVIQPRLGRQIRIAAWSKESVAAFTLELQRAAAATDNPAPVRQANEYCWFCRARSRCPEIRNLEAARTLSELGAGLQVA